MENSKKVKRILKDLDTIYSYLEYYMDGNTGLEVEYIQIRKHIEELSLKQKEHNIRLAKKLRWFWQSDEDN